jgi:hypothetical protein
MADGWPVWTWVPLAAVLIFLGGLALVVGMVAVVSVLVGVVASVRTFVGILSVPLPASWRGWLVDRGLASAPD